MPTFVNYTNYRIQLSDPYATFGVIGLILLVLILVTCRKHNNQFFDMQTTQSLRGIAILCLILGHFSGKCLSEKLFFSPGGYWAVIIFLFISGYGLYQQYELTITKAGFWGKRLTRLYLPLWISLVLFIILDYYLIDLSHPVPELIFNFLGGHFNGALVRVNAVAWFVEYLIVLYIVYRMISKLPLDENIKILILFACCIAISATVYYSPLKHFHKVWLQYTIVFPLGVAFSKYKQHILDFLGLYHWNDIAIGVLLFMFLAIFHNWNEIPIIDSMRYARPFPLICSIILLLILLEMANLQSGFLLLLGKFSYEIYLLHLPFMVKYDFVLFREPLYISFFAYLSSILIMAIIVSKLSSSIMKVCSTVR